MMENLIKNKITCNFGEISKLNLPKNERFILEVTKNETKYEFLLNLKTNTDKLLIFSPGARNLNETPEEKLKPHFQRTEWYFEESTLYFNDPTTYQHNELWAGWGIGTPNTWYLEDIASIIKEIAEYVQVNNDKLLIYGSGVGGFISIALSILLKDSTSVAESPQFDVSKWSDVWENIKQHCLNELTDDEIKELNYRYNIVSLINQKQYVPNLYLILNCKKEYEYIHFYRPFFNSLNQLPYNENKNKIRIRLDPKENNDPPLTYEEVKNVFDNISLINGETVKKNTKTGDFYNTCRVDIVNKGSRENTVELNDFSSADYTVIYPNWMINDEGKGVLLQSDANDLTFKIKCIKDGTLSINLKGLYITDVAQERLPIYIDFTKFEVNGKTIFDTSHLVFHDRSLLYLRKVKDGEVITVHIEWSQLNDKSKLITDSVIKDENLLEEEETIKKSKKASLTIQNIGNSFNGIILLNKPENMFYVSKLQPVEEKNGSQISVNSPLNDIKFSAKFIEKGEMRLKLNEIFNNEDSEEKSYFKKLTVNNEIIFSGENFETYEYVKEIENGENIDIEVEWL